jgi:hypothetical protein
MKILNSPHLRTDEPVYRFVLCAPQKFARGGLASAAKKVRGAGRHGDDTLVHVNKGEFDQIRKAWGEPTINPKTGLPEYFDFSSIVDWLGGPIGKLITSVAGGLLSSHSGGGGAQAPQVPGYVDPNLTTRLPQETSNRTLAPNTMSPSDYYTYGQTGGEHQFFNNNSLADISPSGPITYAPTTGAPAPPPPSATGVAAGLGALKLLQNAKQGRGLVKGLSNLLSPKTVPASVEFPNGIPAAGAVGPAEAGLSTPAAYDAATGVSGVGAGAGATAAAGLGDLAGAGGADAAMSGLAASTPALPASVFGAAAPAAGAGALGAGAGLASPAYTAAINSALGADLGGAAAPAAGSGAASGLGGLGTAALVAAPFLAMYLAGNNKGQPAEVWSGRNDMLSGKIPDEAKPGMRKPPTGYPTWNAYNMAQSIVSDLKNGNSTYTADDWAKVNELAKKYNLTKDTVLPNIPMGGGAIYAHGGAEGGLVDQEKDMKMKKGGLAKAGRGGIMPSSPVAPLGLPSGTKMPVAKSGVNWAPIMPHAAGRPRGAPLGGLGMRHYSMRPRRPSMGGLGGMGAIGKMDQPVRPPQVDAPPMPMGMADGGPVLGANLPPMSGAGNLGNGLGPMQLAPPPPQGGMPPGIAMPVGMPVGMPAQLPPGMRQPLPFQPPPGMLNAGNALAFQQQHPMPPLPGMPYAGSQNPQAFAPPGTAAPPRPPMPMGGIGQGWPGGGMREGIGERFGRMGRPGMPPGLPFGFPNRGFGIPGMGVPRAPVAPPPRPFMQTDPGYAMPQPPSTGTPYMGPIGAPQAMESGGHVSGPGTGRSDQIPARLSDGEYVMDAETVNLLGDGSSAAGAAKLDAMRKRLRMHKGAALAQGKFSPAAKSPEAYMGKAGG